MSSQGIDCFGVHCHKQSSQSAQCAAHCHHYGNLPQPHIEEPQHTCVAPCQWIQQPAHTHECSSHLTTVSNPPTLISFPQQATHPSGKASGPSRLYMAPLLSLSLSLKGWQKLSPCIPELVPIVVGSSEDIEDKQRHTVGCQGSVVDWRA